jgi:hypothetical protein
LAETLQISPRSLRRWKQDDREGSLTPSLRGRPPLSADVPTRNAVIHFVHHVTGPAVGLPALRALFPEVRRAVLANILSRYRRVWRRRYRRWGFELTWHGPGVVWAMDHSQAREPVDGCYPYLFAVRDLASHRQLAWYPVMTQRAEEVIPILRELFAQHGPPLVLKSDNGSAFVAGITQQAMLEMAVAQLFSPAGRPQYNGALERSNSTLKTYTQQQAIAEGHPFRWTSADLDAARQLANTITRPWGHRGPSPDERWQAREPLTDAERATFTETLEAERLQAAQDLGLDPNEPLSHTDRSRLDRLAIERTLEKLGYLTKRRVQHCLRHAKRRGHDEMKRRARKAGLEARLLAATEPITTERDASAADCELSRRTAVAAGTRETCAADAMAAKRAVQSVAKNRIESLALPATSDILPVSNVSDACREHDTANTPTPLRAHGEPTVTTGWRRPFTLLISRLKAAIFSR